MSRLILDHKIIREIFDKNPEFEVEVQSKILKTALRGRVQSINDSAFDKFTTKIKAEADAILEERLGKFTNKGWKPQFTINKAIKNNIETEVGTAYRKILRDMVSEAEKSVHEYAKERMNSIESLVDGYIEKTVNQGLAKIINDKVEAELDKIRKGL